MSMSVNVNVVTLTPDMISTFLIVENPYPLCVCVILRLGEQLFVTLQLQKKGPFGSFDLDTT